MKSGTVAASWKALLAVGVCFLVLIGFGILQFSEQKKEQDVGMCWGALSNRAAAEIAGIDDGGISFEESPRKFRRCEVLIRSGEKKRSISIEVGPTEQLMWPYLGLIGKNLTSVYSQVRPMGGGVNGIVSPDGASVWFSRECGGKINPLAESSVLSVVVNGTDVEDGERYTPSVKSSREITLKVARGFAKSADCSVSGLSDPDSDVPAMKTREVVSGRHCGLDGLQLTRDVLDAEKLDLSEHVVGSRRDVWSCLLEVRKSRSKESDVAALTVTNLPPVVEEVEKRGPYEYNATESAGKAVVECRTGKKFVSLEYARDGEGSDAEVVWKEHLVKLPDVFKSFVEFVADEKSCASDTSAGE